jgi:hypothetical protein
MPDLIVLDTKNKPNVALASMPDLILLNNTCLHKPKRTQK